MDRYRKPSRGAGGHHKVAKKKLIGWIVLLAAVGAAATFAPAPQREQAAAPARGASEARGPDAPAQSPLEALPARESFGAKRGELFSARSWTAPAASGATLSPTPGPPPMPYRVAGQVMHDGSAHIVLARGDAVLVVREGEILEGGYRVEAIRSDRVTLLYEAMGTRNDLPLVGVEIPALATVSAGAATPAAPGATALAQLRWEGPARVQAGTTFNVALKLTSEEALRATPLQLSFDAAVLEPVEVRAGRYFADGTFSYRINPSGSIFVGASGKGSSANGAELVIVSFKGIRSGTTAELKLSSVLLQGAAGRPIAHDQPATFRTAIIQ
jgi:hypothetical protein